MAGAPTAKVEVEFTAGVWTDVTAYWDAKRPITMTAGRSDTDDRVPPGRLSGLWLDNSDGRFTVGNASGAYYPNVTSGKKVRISIADPYTKEVAEYSDTYTSTYEDLGPTWYTRFTGRIEGWPLSWEDNGSTCWVNISATDLLNDWAVATMPLDWMYRAALSQGAIGYWEGHTLDAAGAIPARIGGGSLANLGAAPTTMTAEGLPGDPRKLPEYTYGSSSTAIYKGAAPKFSANSWSVSAWIRITSDPPSTGYYPVVVEQVVAVPPGNRVAIRVKTDQVYASTISSGNIVTDRAASGVDVCDGSWHHVLIKVTDSGGGLGTIAIMVDGANVSTGSISTSTLLADSTISRTVALGTTTTGVVGHVAMWNNASMPSTQQEMAGPGAGLEIDSPTDRLSQIASLAGLTAPTVQGTARTTMTNSSPLGFALDAARLVEDTDGGLLWCNGAGTVIYNASLSRWSGAALALSLTAADVGPGLAVAADRTGVVNESTVTNTAPLSSWRPDPVTQTVALSDTSSVTAMGRRPRELATACIKEDERHIANRAADLLSLSEAPRIPTVEVDVMALTNAQQLSVLGVEVWDDLAVTGLPSAGGFDTNWLGRIEGWAETVGIDQWSVAFNCSFAGNRLGDATHGLILGSNRLG